MLHFLVIVYLIGYLITLADLLIALPKSCLPEVFPVKLPTSYFCTFLIFPYSMYIFAPLCFILNENIVFILCSMFSVIFYPLTLPFIAWAMAKHRF